ncbi:MAG: hypothetical protein IKP60_06840 [Treponema sp.]|nr:hypothetical protein [Treponema sp.]
MRFYKNQHQFYIGIDLHARTMYICVINNIGETVFHKTWHVQEKIWSL